MGVTHIHLGRVFLIRLLAGLMLLGVIALLVAIVPGWSEGKARTVTTAPTTRSAARLVVPEGEVRFRQWQRTTKGLPGAGDQVRLSIGDVTGGKVKVSVGLTGDETLVPERAMSEGDKLQFTLDEREYEIAVEELRNALIGDDEVVFMLREVDANPPAALSEEQKIERLIAAVGELRGATFIRNGGEHSPADAVEHMRRKWENGKGRIRTAKDFITHAASRSSLTGEAYRIRMPDGMEVTSETFLMKTLRQMEAATTRAAKGDGGGA